MRSAAIKSDAGAMRRRYCDTVCVDEVGLVLEIQAECSRAVFDYHWHLQLSLDEKINSGSSFL